MRPINLIPADQRRNSKAPVRSGPIAYLLIGALALGLGAVTLMVLTNNKIADRKSEIAELQQREAAATAEAQQYAPFTSFASLQKSRHDTVQSLADSRFDWERVMRELSLIIPSTVSLTQLTATAGGGADASSTATSTSGTSISSPSLQLIGCARGQEGVAAFISALRDIDGVTRVGLTSSERPEETAESTGGAAAGAAAGDAAAAGGGEECATSDSVAKFDLTVAFDNAPTPQAPSTTPTTPTAPTTPPATGTPASTTTSTTPTTPAAPATDTGTPASTTP